MRNIKELLTKLSDKDKYTSLEIYTNLKDCLKGKKCCLFSCGANLLEHKDNYYKLYNDNDFIIACWKGSVEFLDFNCDILGIGNHINGSYLNNSKINNIFTVGITNNEWDKNYNYKHNYSLKIKKDTIPVFLQKTDNIKFYNNEIYSTNFMECDIYIFILFLKYLGIEEFYLFGFYLSNNPLDILNYSFEKDIVEHNFHYYETNLNIFTCRTKEPGLFYDQYQSSILNEWAKKNNVYIYNVSINGWFSNSIKRIDFEDIYKNNKNIQNPKTTIRDFKDSFDMVIDIEYYSSSYGIESNYNACLIDYINQGIYLNRKLFKDDKKNEFILNYFDLEFITYINIINKYPEPNKNMCAYFSHFYIYSYKYFFPYHLNENDILNLIKKYNINDSYYDDNDLSIYNDYLIKINFDIDYIKNKNFYLVHYIFLNINYEDSLPNDFDWKIYVQLNCDLSNMTENEAKIHYLCNGIYEKRNYLLNDVFSKLPNDFDWKIYVQLNGDLSNMTENEAKIHYLCNGIYEKRNYKKLPN